MKVYITERWTTNERRVAEEKQKIRVQAEDIDIVIYYFLNMETPNLYMQEEIGEGIPTRDEKTVVFQHEYWHIFFH